MFPSIKMEKYIEPELYSTFWVKLVTKNIVLGSPGTNFMHMWVKLSSFIAPLSLLINSERLLCLEGRLKTANISPSSKHQYLILKYHLIARLLITDIHLNYAHCGKKYTLFILHQKYWRFNQKHITKSFLL